MKRHEHPIINHDHKYNRTEFRYFVYDALDQDAAELQDIIGRMSEYRDALVNRFADTGGNPFPQDHAQDLYLSNGDGTGQWGLAQAAVEIAYEMVAALRSEGRKFHADYIAGGN